MRHQLAALFLMLPVAALAQSDSADQKPAANPENTTVSAPAPSSEEPKPVKLVCVKMAAETGSHMGGRRECHTQQEWDMMHRQSESYLRDNNRAINQATPGSGR